MGIWGRMRSFENLSLEQMVSGMGIERRVGFQPVEGRGGSTGHNNQRAEGTKDYWNCICYYFIFMRLY